ncbi:MAG: response regulator transcription factor [Bacteroidales bacterium]|nr:response regulator transcription factor [Bacteroidales bacterium]
MKIIICDDHTLFRNGLRMLLQSCYANADIKEAANGQEFLLLLKQFVPDIILMDIDMPVTDGIKATSEALAMLPELKIIALSMFGDEIYYYRMIAAGAKGFMLKNSEINDVTEAIDTVLAGDVYFSKELLINVVKNLRNEQHITKNEEILTSRELEILELICLGNSNAEIGEKLFISKRTVDKHRANMLEKTNSRNTAQLVMNAIRHQWIRT